MPTCCSSTTPWPSAILTDCPLSCKKLRCSRWTHRIHVWYILVNVAYFYGKTVGKYYIHGSYGECCWGIYPVHLWRVCSARYYPIRYLHVACLFRSFPIDAPKKIPMHEPRWFITRMPQTVPRTRQKQVNFGWHEVGLPLFINMILVAGQFFSQWAGSTCTPLEPCFLRFLLSKMPDLLLPVVDVEKNPVTPPLAPQISAIKWC